jgi:lantibiotic modifying enzyme
MKRAPVLAGVLFVAQLCSGQSKYLDVAVQSARWIQSSAIKSGNGIAWPADPRDPKSVQTNLYSGTPGVVLFLLEAYRSTGNRGFLDQARSGADFLIASLPGIKGEGLYEGIAGVAFCLQEAFKASGDRKYRDAAARCVEQIRAQAVSQGKGIAWSPTTDIISGSAGTGLFLLYATREMNDPNARKLAVQAGTRLIELGIPQNGGSKWAMDPKFPRLMPNFSHGTAGIAYFLATLYQETKDKVFLEAALAGAKYLLSIADTEADSCLIFHNEPDNKDLYYLGWCHGPTGTARLFYRLYQATGDSVWMDWVKKSARGVMQSGIPDKQTPGFWNNVSICCGSAGVAEFFLDLHRVTRDPQYLKFCQKMTGDLLSKAARDSNGTRWIQAEHRTRPDFLVAQTGMMQGAAGIGMWLLHMDAFERGKKPSIVLPDSPF